MCKGVIITKEGTTRRLIFKKNEASVWFNFISTYTGKDTLYVFENDKLLYHSSRDYYGVPCKCYDKKGQTPKEIFKEA